MSRLHLTLPTAAGAPPHTVSCARGVQEGQPPLGLHLSYGSNISHVATHFSRVKFPWLDLELFRRGWLFDTKSKVEGLISVMVEWIIEIC